MTNAIRPIHRYFCLIYCILLLAGCSPFDSSDPPGPPALTSTPVQTANVPTLAPQDDASPAAPTPAPPTAAPTITPWADYKPDSLSAGDCTYGGAFRSIEALDPYTVRFSLCQPDVAFLSKVAFPSFAVYPKEWLAQIGHDGFSPNEPIGSGPYRLAEWVQGERLSFTAFDDYRLPDKPLIPELEIRWEREMSARLLALEADGADGIDAVSADDFPALRSDTTKTLAIRPPLSIAYLGMNHDYAPFDDERVRRAIAMGIDRSKLLADAFPEGYEAALYFTPCIIPAGCEGEPMPAFDPDEGRRLLAEAGYPGGFDTHLYYAYVVRSYMPWPNLVAENLKKQLFENLGIRILPKSQLEDAFNDAVDSGTVPGIFLSGWGADYPDVDNFLGVHFGSRAGLQFGQAFDDLRAALDQALTTGEADRRQEAYTLANSAFSRHVPVVPLAHGGWASADNRAIAFSTQVQGLQTSPFGIEDFSSLSFSGQERYTFRWLQQYEPLNVFCPLAEDIESLRACAQIAETLYRYTPGGVAVEPALAQSCTPDESLQTWTCTLQSQIHFHDGSALDANDVVASFAAQWDAASPLHALDGGEFPFFQTYWPGFLHDRKP